MIVVLQHCIELTQLILWNVHCVSKKTIQNADNAVMMGL